MENKPQMDFIAIGDTVIDAFIRISAGHIQETAHGRELCIPYGMKVPFDDVFILPAVGNSANASVSASRLGLSSALLTSLGKDAHGDECLAQLKKENISTDYIRQEEGKKTNYHYVLWKDDDRTILIKHEQFTPVIPDIGSPKWLYLSSLGGHTLPFHHELIEYVKNHPDIKLAFQPGTFQLGFGAELAELYKITDVVCMNKEEAEQLLNLEGVSVQELMDGLEKMGPKVVIVTDGPHGAYMKYDNTYFSMPLYPDIAPPLERTGAGDAFFSTFIAYLAKGYDAPYAMRRAPINSMNVVQHVGAQEGLLTEAALEEYLKKAAESYTLSIMK
jgi:sugar/nucleoside kinase (ribokinase family)